MAHTKLTTVGAAEAVGADAFRTTGTSPTQRSQVRTVHLLGPGAVGRALLERIATSRLVLTAVTDSSATIHDPAGLDARAVQQWKACGRSLADHRRGRAQTALQAVSLADADIVVDATSTELDRNGWNDALDHALQRGAGIALAAKAAACERGADWLDGEFTSQVGCNAVLGGTGATLLAELPDLRRRVRGVAIAGNASTTAIIEVIERGGTLTDGIADAQQRGYLEADPELDLRGDDAAVKLAIVAGILGRRRIDPRVITRTDIRELDAFTVRERVRRNATTRLIARLHADGTLSVSYEEIARDSLLATPCGRVVYDYQLDRDERRIHVGTGLGAGATADALWHDVITLARTSSNARDSALTRASSNRTLRTAGAA